MRAHPSVTGAHALVTGALPSVMRADAVARRALPSCTHRKAVVSRHNMMCTRVLRVVTAHNTKCTPDNTIAIVSIRICRHADKVNSYNNRVVTGHNTIVIVSIRMCRRAIKGKSYRNRVVMHHNSIVIAAIRMCTLAGKEKTIVAGCALGGVGLRCANRDLRRGWAEGGRFKVRLAQHNPTSIAFHPSRILPLPPKRPKPCTDAGFGCIDRVRLYPAPHRAAAGRGCNPGTRPGDG